MKETLRPSPTQLNILLMKVSRKIRERREIYQIQNKRNSEIKKKTYNILQNKKAIV